MVNRPSTPEIITVNSEALQTQIRDLLPSQSGFGSELQATNVITPIIDLTAAAEGSGLATDLARSLAFGSQTAFEISNATTSIATSPGFYRAVGAVTVINNVSASNGGGFKLTDGSTTKQVWAVIDNGQAAYTATTFDLTFWLAAGESLQAFTDNVSMTITGSVRQVADSQGSTVNPSGYPL